MQTVVKDVLLNFKVFGQSKSKTILILHGWGRSSDDWVVTAKKIEDKARIILVDIPGFGGSINKSNNTLSVFDYANIFSEFINKEKLNNVTLVGHSLGGKISVVLANINPHIKKLVLISPSGFSKKAFFVAVKIFVYRILKPFVFLLPKAIKSRIIKLVASEDYLQSGSMKETFKQVVKDDVVSSARQIKIPTTIVWAEFDEQVALPSSKYLKSLIKNSLLRIVWRSGHHPHLEKPEQFMQILNQSV